MVYGMLLPLVGAMGTMRRISSVTSPAKLLPLVGAMRTKIDKVHPDVVFMLLPLVGRWGPR